jgi:Fe2+ or Zn2+ uptake regulation protein
MDCLLNSRELEILNILYSAKDNKLYGADIFKELKKNHHIIGRVTVYSGLAKMLDKEFITDLEEPTYQDLPTRISRLCITLTPKGKTIVDIFPDDKY